MDKRKTRTRATRATRRIINTNTKTMTRREQVVISRLRTGYIRATHFAVMDKELSRECPFCAVNLTTNHILWHCKETETETTTNGHMKVNLEGRKTSDGKADQIRERNKIFLDEI
jgi:hypothetical protein